jgi:hypothetical protein
MPPTDTASIQKYDISIFRHYDFKRSDYFGFTRQQRGGCVPKTPSLTVRTLRQTQGAFNHRRG